MPEQMKPDWKQLIRERIASAEPGNDIPLEVVAELATHLEEIYDDARAKSPTADAAITVTLQEVRDWHVLAADIRGARSKENLMNQRTKKLWLPGLASLVINAVLIVVFERVHAGQLALRLVHFAMMVQLGWLTAMIVAGGAKLEEALMNQRTRSIWLPGFVSLTVASLFLFAEEILLLHDSSFYFTDLNLKTPRLISGVPSWFYLGWLFAQVLCGALGAFLSRRGGGTRAARVIAGAFPAIVMFAICTIVIPISAIFEHNSFALRHPSALAFGVLIWAGAPAMALLLGAAPFLREAEFAQLEKSACK
jgi:hypothetical protein